MPDAFYHTKRWERLRASILRRDRYMCQISRRYGKRREAQTVHHIFPRDRYPEYQWEPWNLISICSEIHEELHNRQTGALTAKGMELLRRTAKAQGIMMESRLLVVGLPGSGKTIYARSHMDSETLVYDLDAIAAAFRLNEPHAEYHEGSRRMANDLLASWAEHAQDYARKIIVIRSAPSVEEAEALNPDKIIYMTRRYIDRDTGNETQALKRIGDLIRWANANGVPVQKDA